MSRDEYVKALRDLLGGAPTNVVLANRTLYKAAFDSEEVISTATEADLALAEAGS